MIILSFSYKFKNITKYFFFLLFVWQFGNTQELPLVNQFSPEDYNAESQNWSVGQGINGYVYVANNKGLLEFNGADWNLYPTPNQTIMRSVKVLDQKVFTGFYMDFGFWERDAFGLLQFTSLVAQNQLSLLPDEQFWNILELDGWILFQSLQRIYIYNLKTKEVKIINSDSSITKMFKVENDVYFQELGKGVFRIEDGKPKLITNKKELQENRITLVFKKTNQLIFLTQDKGFFTVEDKYTFENPELQNFLNRKTVYSALRLENQNFIIGTISNGLIYANVKGKIIFSLNQTQGLSNNTVLSTFEDRKGDVWLGLDYGINKIDITSPFRIYKDLEGKLGTVYTSAYHQGYLYLGTNQGLFYKKYPSIDNFSFVESTQGQVWNLHTIDSELFCSHNSGVFSIENRVARKINDISGAWGVKKIKEGKLLQGSYDGLYILEKKKGNWKVLNKINGFDNSCRFFELYGDNTIFINHEYKGVYKLKIDQNFTAVIESKIDTSVVKGLHSSLLKYQNKIIYAYKGGVYKYSESKSSFEKDTVLNTLISEKDFLTGKLIFAKHSNKLFSFSKDNLSYLRPDKFSTEAVIVKKGIKSSLRKGAVGYENINRIAEDTYLLGTLNGYLITNLKTEKTDGYTLSINAVKNHAVDEKAKHLALKNTSELELPAKDNSIEFSYSVPYLSKDIAVKYKYKLEGYTEKWSDWNFSNKILFENLSFGDYTFKVKARIGENEVKNIPSFSFYINRAWYISNTAISGYALIVFLFSIFMDRVYKRYYRRQRESLLKKQQKDFQLKTLEKEKELIEIKNTQLEQDVESKNRELAISTMSMIKKNELLNALKKDIVKGDEKSLQSVIKTIDQNLNNTDDWKMFEEAFNNADKDFINKIKKLHDNLTPNDLRLCAYLRLNLTSKEIAPLFNISVRSVEIKRYRLRKKLDLPQKANLIEYILSV